MLPVLILIARVIIPGGCVNLTTVVPLGGCSYVKNPGNPDKTCGIPDEKTISAVRDKFSVLGEAVKNIPDDIRRKYPAIAKIWQE